VQNGDDALTVTLLLLAADRHARRASVSTAITVERGAPAWRTRLADRVASRAREGAERLGTALSSVPEPDLRFIPLAEVVPVIRLVH